MRLPSCSDSNTEYSRRSCSAFGTPSRKLANGYPPEPVGMVEFPEDVGFTEVKS